MAVDSAARKAPANMDHILTVCRQLSTSFSDLVDKLNVSTCYLCDANHAGPDKICRACRLDLPTPVSPCPICADRWPGLESPPEPDTGTSGGDLPTALPCCPRCRGQRPPYRRCVTAFAYAFPVDVIIRQFKYERREYWARALAEASMPVFQRHFATLQGVLVPVPLHSGRLGRRGFNQAESLASELSRLCGWPVMAELSVRTRATPKQSLLDAEQRRRNLADAFACRMPAPAVPVVIIDDVITTGSTIAAMTDSLLQAGVREVHVFGFARANRREDQSSDAVSPLLQTVQTIQAVDQEVGERERSREAR